MSIGETFEKVIDWGAQALGLDSPYEEDPEGTFVFDGGREYDVVGNTAAVREPERYQAKREKERGNVTKLSNYKGHEVRIIDPRSYGDTTQIVDQLIENKTVILNLHLLDKENAQKTIDFVCGATYAIGGTVQKVGDTVFVFTPNTVQLSVEAKESNAFGTNSFWGSTNL